MRKKVIAGNWKMNKNFMEAEELLDDINDYLKECSSEMVEVVVCPPACFMELVTDYAEESTLMVGAQNVSEHKGGAYTGEISAEMLSSMDVDFSIVGHSERRKYFSETDAQINSKIKNLLEVEVLPILCVGETLEEREAGSTLDIIKTQLVGALKDVEVDLNLVIAYEPVWAIGTGKTATPAQAQEVHAFIRNWLRENYSDVVADTIHILYGGSMNPVNAQELLDQEDIDGGLIGGAALDFEKFTAIIDIAKGF